MDYLSISKNTKNLLGGFMKTEDYNKQRTDNKRVNNITHTIIESEKPSEFAKKVFDRKPYYLTVPSR